MRQDTLHAVTTSLLATYFNVTVQNDFYAKIYIYKQQSLNVCPTDKKTDCNFTQLLNNTNSSEYIVGFICQSSF
jgi:hypothetical protein